VKRSLRVFTDGPADSGAQWTEVTRGDEPVVRVKATDLRRAQQQRARLRDTDDVAVVLDITVLIADSYRAASRRMVAVDAAADSIQYVGTLEGLAGLVRDVFTAEVADGVTLIPAIPDQDVRALALATLARSGFELTGDPAFQDGERRCG
jgi:hypothetical protein